VLILENPALRGQSCITPTLYAGLQLILPGEVAPAHRHTQSALRLVLDGEGAYTAVDGERTTMRRGDFIITPAWTWHDHGNPGEQPVVWLDGLDIPLVRFLDAGFAEKAEASSQPTLRPEGDALARYGANMLPVDYTARPADPTRVFVYPYERTVASLQAIARGTPDAHHGFKLRYVNPATGASPMPTIGAFAQWLPAGFETKPLRSTDGTVHVCLQGRGEARVGEKTWRFDENDVFVVPSWQALQLRADTDALLFSFSDRPVQQAVGLWREQRLWISSSRKEPP
jgi:gentisate 1,2-dioxygenase